MLSLRRLFAPFAVTAVVVVAGCSGSTAAAPVTVTMTAGPGAPGPTSGSFDLDSTAAAPILQPPTPVPNLSAPASPTSPPPTSPPPAISPGPRITTVPAADATGVSPIAPVVVNVTAGSIGSVSVTNPDGRSVKGTYSADRSRWTSGEPLAYDGTYTITAAANGPTGTSTSSGNFTTLTPRVTVFPSFFPNPSMKAVGIGQPMVVIFDKPPADRAAAERALTVTTVPAVQGTWSWIDRRTVHYRPKQFWKPGTKITVSANLYGVDLGNGMYGEMDRTLDVTVGPSKIAKIDDATKQMQVFIDGKLVRTVPVSMGQSKEIAVAGKKISLVTPSGIYIAQEKYPVKRMSSATYGLPTDYDLGYDKNIPLAVRLSNGGIFVHSAPWSVADQGVRNVSHGCININPQAARWFYNTFSFGDVVEVTGTSTALAPTDGFGDWNIGWSTWQQGSVLN